MQAGQGLVALRARGSQSVHPRLRSRVEPASCVQRAVTCRHDRSPYVPACVTVAGTAGLPASAAPGLGGARLPSHHRLPAMTICDNNNVRK